MMPRAISNTELWKLVTWGRIWGIRPDGQALAHGRLFDMDVDATRVVRIQLVRHQSQITAWPLSFYGADLWRPEDFLPVFSPYGDDLGTRRADWMKFLLGDGHGRSKTEADE